MKNIYLLLLFLTPVFYAGSQTILHEDFEGSTFPPAGWALSNGNAAANFNWYRNTDTFLAYVNTNKKSYPAFQGTGSLIYELDTVAASAWAITPALQLTRGISYHLTFYFAAFNARYSEKMKVTVGNAAAIANQTTILWDNNGGAGIANDSAWTKAIITYSPAVSGNYFFGFNCYSDANKYALLVDDITLEQAPAEIPLCGTKTYPANGVINVSAPQALFTWNSVPSVKDYIFKFGTNPSPDSVDHSSMNTTYRSDLAYNTTYYWSIIPKNDMGTASGCPVYSFTTQAAPPVPLNNDCSGAVEITAGASVQGSTKSATQSLQANLCNGTAGNANDDIWFKYTAPESGSAVITLTPDLIFDGVIEGYSGTCGSLVNIACADNGFDGDTETLTLPEVVQGQTYYIRVYGFDDAGQDGSFTLTASGRALPVSLTAFKGWHSVSQNILSWTTLSEQNNKSFKVQRSANGKDFSTIASISSGAPDGNSSSPLAYHFVDVKPLAGNNYYRLQQSDKDGKSTFSGIILLKEIQLHNLALSGIYPNPAKAFVHVVLTAPAGAKVILSLTDPEGRPVLQQSAQLAIGENNCTLDVSKIAAGTYLLKAVSANGQQVAVSKFVKQ